MPDDCRFLFQIFDRSGMTAQVQLKPTRFFRNANGEWVAYDENANTVSVASIDGFVLAFKSASKNLGAFDQLDGGQGENVLFGYGDGNGAHFDAGLAKILSDLESEYAAGYAEDLQKTDVVGYGVDKRDIRPGRLPSIGGFAPESRRAIHR